MIRSYHDLPPQVVQRFRQEHEIICRRLIDQVSTMGFEKRLESLRALFIKTQSALHRHRYTVIHWKEVLEERLPLFEDHPQIQKTMRDLQHLLTEIIRETRKQN